MTPDEEIASAMQDLIDIPDSGLTVYMLDPSDLTRPIPTRDMLAWSRWFDVFEHRIVRHTEIEHDPRDGNPTEHIGICTDFLGLDHGFGWMRDPPGPPVLWETMVFNGPLNGVMDRYSTHAEAIEGHERLVRAVHRALAGATRDELNALLGRDDEDDG